MKQSDVIDPRTKWSIGIYMGESPLQIRPAPGVDNPVLTAGDVRDIRAAFVADPFLCRDDDRWHLFCEVWNQATGLGEIGLAVSGDGLHWNYQKTVLREPFHLSYPLVFSWEGEHYMVPETLATGRVVLYRAAAFPYEWRPAATLINGTLADPTLFRFDDHWWMFACSTPSEHDTLRFFHADELCGPWHEHPLSPLIVANPRAARPGGRTTRWNGGLIRFAQDCTPVYGSRLRAFEITVLTERHYAEREAEESPVLVPNADWNLTGMHHADPYRLPDGTWIAAVDGYVHVD